MAANKLRILAARGPKQRKGRQAVAPWPRAPVASGRIPECEIDADGAAPSLQDLPTTIRWLPSLSDPTGATLGGGSSGVAEQSGTSRRGRSLSKRRGGFYRRRPEALARPLGLSEPPPGLGNRLKW